MNTQARIRDHLTQQKARALAPHDNGQGAMVPGCAYRGDNGTRCAVGCLISDEEYSPVWEGKTVGQLIEGMACGHGIPRWTPPRDVYIMDMVRWQEYHDTGARLFGSHGSSERVFNYQTWLVTGDPGHSPEAFYQALKEAGYVHEQ